MCRTHAAAGRRLLAFVAVCLIGTAAQGQPSGLDVSFRSRSMQPGEAVLALITAPAATTAVSVSGLGGDWVADKQPDGRWRALLGIDLDTKPGSYDLVLRSKGQPDLEHHARITVLPKRFRRRVLKVAPEFVNPPPDILERIRLDSERTRDAYSRTSTEPGWRYGFTRPVPEVANSSFGTRSVFNGEARNPHAGTDFLSPSGTPIRAPAGGRVVLAADLFFTGNTVIIDHGLGVFSMLAHLSRIDVHDLDDVPAGRIVGAVGATGRVTGPHLHWALRIGHARVDALSALALLPGDR